MKPARTVRDPRAADPQGLGGERSLEHCSSDGEDAAARYPA